MDDFYILETMGQFLTRKRLETNFSPLSIAEAVKGVSISLYESIENDLYTPSVDMASEICKVLNIDWNYFYYTYRELLKDRAKKNKLNRGKR